MPNWCENSLEVAGTKEDIKKFKSQANLEAFFESFIPKPSDIFLGDINQEAEKKYGDKNWYDWNIKNWGTKWDASEPELMKETERMLIYNFLTAWSPPIEWLEKVTKLYPALRFKLTYNEPGMAFHGRAKAYQGKLYDKLSMEDDPEAD